MVNEKQMNKNATKEKLWQEMADLTYQKCKEKCHNLGCCCSGDYCDIAAEYMESKGVEVPPMPFLDKNGKCSIPPQFRPLCTVHQCDIANLGCDPKDPKWTKKYFKLRDKLNEIGV